ncbi:MAG: flippase-like domain-containing protein [Chloroflexi bacterium]|nr:MAG: flippase-like domain-containing protein [Chloroflexota bacterium]
MGARPPRAERDRQFRGAAVAPAAYPRLHRRIPLLQSSRPAVPRYKAAAIVWILGARRAANPLRARRADDRRGPDHLYGSHPRAIQDLAPGDLSRHGHGLPARRPLVSRRRLLQAVVLLALGVLILYGLLRTVHPDQVVRAIRGANPGWIAVGLAGYLAFIVIRGWRWLVILKASAPAATLGDATAVTAIGFAVNAVSPFKLGELLRIGTIAPRARIGVGEATATVVVERVLDVLALLVIALAAAAIAGGGSNSFALWSGVVVIAAGSLVIGAVAYLMVSYPRATLAAIDRIAALLPTRVGAFVDRFAASVLKGLASLRSPVRLATAGFLSILIWLCIDLGLMACFRALTPQLSFPTLALACTIFIISQAISITPGSVGTYEGFFLLVLSTFGARPAALVTAAAVLNHVGNIVVLLLAGAIGALWLRVRRPALPVGLERPVPS